MNKPIVVPLDGSRLAEKALAPAISIANALNADIHLLTIGTVGAQVISVINDLRLRIAEELNAASVISSRAEGSVASTIISYARQVDARMIVMATRRRDDHPRHVLSSVTDRVARHAGLPVLIAGPQTTVFGLAEPWRCRRILVPLDGSARAELIIEPISMLAAAFGSRITLMRVVSAVPSVIGYPSVPLGLPFEPFSNEHDASAHLEAVATALRNRAMVVDTRTVTSTLSVPIAIIKEAYDTRADLVAIATRGHGFARRLAFGSVAKELVKYGGRPIVVLSPAESVTHTLSRDTPEKEGIHT